MGPLFCTSTFFVPQAYTAIFCTIPRVHPRRSFIRDCALRCARFAVGSQWPAPSFELLPTVSRNDVHCLPGHNCLPLRVTLLKFVPWCHKVLCYPGLFDIHQIHLSFLSPQRITATRTMELPPSPDLTMSDEIPIHTLSSVCAWNFDPVIATLCHAPSINSSLRKLARHYFNRFWFEAQVALHSSIVAAHIPCISKAPGDIDFTSTTADSVPSKTTAAMTQTRFDMDKRFTHALQSWPSYLPELRNCIGELRQKTVNQSLYQYMKDRIASSGSPAKEVLRSTRFLVAQLYSIELQRFQNTNPSPEQLRFCLSREFMRHHLELLE